MPNVSFQYCGVTYAVNRTERNCSTTASGSDCILNCGWVPAACRQCLSLFITARSNDPSNQRAARESIFIVASYLNRPYQHLFARPDARETFSDCWLKERFGKIEAKRRQKSDNPAAVLSDVSSLSKISFPSPNPRDLIEAT